MKEQGLGVISAAMAAGLLVAMPAMAQQGACINDNNGNYGKVCAEISALPSDVVQASKLDGVRETFVSYTARITNISNPTSSRKLEATFTLSPAVDIVAMSSSAGACSTSGATVSCSYDKLAVAINDDIEFTAKAPEFAGTSTPSTLIATGVFGWKGRTETVSKTLAVSTSGGYTWVPPNTEVALVTSPENPNPSQQTDANNPLWAKMVLPGRSTGYLASLSLNLHADEDFTQSCSAGLFYSGNSDGGPYICRDIGFPYDAGVGTRWIQVEIDDSVDGTFTDDPVEVTLIWDESIISPAQFEEDAPDVAMFYHAQEAQGSNETHPIRAFAQDCGSAAPPCLTNVLFYGTNDLTATLNLSEVHNGGAEADPTVPPSVTDLLAGLQDYLFGVAWGELQPPVIMR